jgi:exoribonuclease R
VGRIDIRSLGGETLPYESGNVTLMSALGLKVTEGRVHTSKLTEDQHAHWLRWAEAHTTNTNVTTTKTDELEDAIDERKT